MCVVLSLNRFVPRIVKTGLKNTRDPYHSVENYEIITMILSFYNTQRNKVIINNGCFIFLMVLLFLCYHGNSSKEEKCYNYLLIIPLY